MIATTTIAEQLVYIYHREEWWHATTMPYDEALAYHQKGLDNGTIHVYEQDGEVLGYYERFIDGNVVDLRNVWVKDGLRRGEVFRALYRHFFDNLPDGIDYIIGEKQRAGGKKQKVKINKERIYGKYENRF